MTQARVELNNNDEQQCEHVKDNEDYEKKTRQTPMKIGDIIKFIGSNKIHGACIIEDYQRYQGMPTSKLRPGRQINEQMD